MYILITGAAGFIGFHLSKKLLEEDNVVIGVDNLNNYYSSVLKKDRLKILEKHSSFSFYKVNIADFKAIKKVFEKHKIDVICHLAAQAGVRYSLENPFVYEQSNVLGTLNILEIMRKKDINKLVYASSSSVYGGIKKIPFDEQMDIDKPISLYAATKAATELFVETYCHLFGFKCVGLRYFTAYGPWGRPDMAYFLFTDAIVKGKPIKVFNCGNMKRDFTYIDDVIEGTISAIEKVDQFNHEVFNLGYGDPVNLLDFIKCIEDALGKKTQKKMLPMELGDIKETHADISKAQRFLNYQPKIMINEGVKKFVEWYKYYY